jgi:hypothetical protein
MSQFGLVWRVFGPMLLRHPWSQATGTSLRTVLRLSVAIGAAVATYELAVQVAIEIWPPSRAHAALAYGIGLAFATWLGTCAGALFARPAQRRWVANGVAALAMAVPVALAIRSGGGPAGYLPYLAGTALGGLVALGLIGARLGRGRRHLIAWR